MLIVEIRGASVTCMPITLMVAYASYNEGEITAAGTQPFSSFVKSLLLTL